MFVGRPSAQVMRVDLDQPGRTRPPHDPEIKHRAKVIWKDRDDVKAQHRSGQWSVVGGQ